MILFPVTICLPCSVSFYGFACAEDVEVLKLMQSDARRTVLPKRLSIGAESPVVEPKSSYTFPEDEKEITVNARREKVIRSTLFIFIFFLICVVLIHYFMFFPQVDVKNSVENCSQERHE